MGTTFCTWGAYCQKMRGLLVLACFALFAEANGQEQLVKSEQCDMPPVCPAGCCPIVGGVCCPYLLYCAATFAECPLCPFESRKEIPPNNDCDGTMCYHGCCGNSEGWTCADKPGDCPNCSFECPDGLDWVDCP